MTTASAARIGQTRDWELCDTYEELGLGPDELRRVLRDVPEGWIERDFRRLAVATHAVVSALIGEMGAGRTSIPATLRALAGMAAAKMVVDQDSTGENGEDDDDVEAV